MALVELAQFDNGFEAGLVRGRLSAEDIESFMFDLNVGGAGFPYPVRLMVDEEDLDEATAILASIEG